MTDITEQAKAVREALAFTDLLDSELDLTNEVIDALIAEVRRLRAAIAEADKIHRPSEDVDGMVCAYCIDACSYDHWPVKWPCATHRALHPEGPDHA